MICAAIGVAILLGGARPAWAEPPPAEAPATPTLQAVSPGEFGAGATITITGSNFAEGDVVMIDAITLEAVTIAAGSITATVPLKTKSAKKLILKRNKKKVAELAIAGFVKAPTLTSASPTFAAPGEVVTLKGKNLDRVTTLTLAGAPVKVDELGATSLRFTAPAGTTGPLAVKSVGGEAALKKDYEIFYAPALTAVSPTAAFEGDSVTLTGAHLGAAKFKLGSKPLKAGEQADTKATVTIAKGAKSGDLKAEARKKGSAVAFTVHPTPLLTTVPKEVGAPGTLKVSGKNLDAVATWRLGQVTLVPEAPAGKSKVALTLPDDAPTDQPLVAVSQGREFASKKPVAVIKTPVVEAMSYWPGPEGKGVEGEIRGRELTDKTKFTLAGKSVKTSFVDPTRVTFALTKAPKAAEQALQAKTGKYKGPALTVDGAAGGYSAGPARLGEILAAGGSGYSPAAIAADLEVSRRQPDSGAEALKALGRAATGPEGQADAAAVGRRLALDLRRFTVAQVALCSQMTAGKTQAQAEANAGLGDALRASQKHMLALAGQLRDLWSGLPLAATAGDAGTGLVEVDAEVAAATAARVQVESACKNKFVASGKLLSEAGAVAKVDLPELYAEAIKGAFAAVLAAGKTWPAVEGEVTTRLGGLAAGRKKLWQDVLKASKQAVEGGAAATTGKGARGDKHVEPQGKPKTNTGKGKGKAG
ncbi:IPT/TIG domain-containing protein [Nannocystis punicea]|uniref:IPT/TIG domain-containing protein n=1 Tax=Nannocystis punicea TaxID=2995304 RepID=A0ABY7HAL5_9BACT|nr:IPT/TIG domain-containing protein [Nannocystis poenicansa]WAS96168.1 IPT/TIG domain-containing protein [Nannocystis poenicansa]